MSDKTVTFEEALAKFTGYAVDVRGDWSDFDGRELLGRWWDARDVISAAHQREVAEAEARVWREADKEIGMHLQSASMGFRKSALAAEQLAKGEKP
jgi:hypothetical protein